MSTILQKEFFRYDGVNSTSLNPVYVHVAKVVTMTMAAGAAVATTALLPKGSLLSSVRFETPTAITGTPTNINARVGTASTGQQVVADVDVKAQGHITGTIVTALDVTNIASTADQILYLALAAVGGTNPAGTIYAVVSYMMPKPQ